MDEVIDYAQDGLRLFYDFHEKHRSAVDGFAIVPALNMSLVDGDGNVDYYHGAPRIVDKDKRIVREFDYHDYLDHFSEAVEEWSYMKFPFLKDLGREEGSVRVGPLGRMNVTNSLSTPLAQEALERFHAYTGGAPNNMTLHTNWARTIEVLHAAELIEELLRDPGLQNQDLVVTPAADAWVGEGVGVVEAPRGTLLHHYRASAEGDITFANLIVATTHNNQVINRTVRSVADAYLEGRAEITEAMMNAIEVGIRAYDPCLSCATHAYGEMPLVVTLYNGAGSVINERVRP
jgi:NAD-reducing hydrogenase large subunit